MSRNRLFYVLVAFAVLVVAVLTLHTAVATSAVSLPARDAYDEVERNRSLFLFGSGDSSYDGVEHIRAQRDSLNAADRSYDEVESIRSQRHSFNAADHSYDEIEHIRSQRDGANAAR